MDVKKMDETQKNFIDCFTKETKRQPDMAPNLVRIITPKEKTKMDDDEYYKREVNTIATFMALDKCKDFKITWKPDEIKIKFFESSEDF